MGCFKSPDLWQGHILGDGLHMNIHRYSMTGGYISEAKKQGMSWWG
jgi:hypothetical protein